MCGCPEMESYEDFCLRSLAILQEGGKFKKTTFEPLWSLKALSVIRFHGRAVLSPLLSAEQRSEMCDHRKRAVQLELDRQNQQNNNLLARVQDILDQAQAHTVPSEDVVKMPVSKSATVSGYTLVIDSPGLPRIPGFGLQTNDEPATTCSETPILNGCKVVEDVVVEREEKSEEEEVEEEEDEDISLDSLLKRSREYVKKERSQQGSKIIHTVTRSPPLETVSDKENKSYSPMGDTGVEFGFSLHHSPIGQPQTHIQHQTLYDHSPQQSGCLSPSLPDQFDRLPSPESSISPRAQRRRPRPFSTGNIHISFPIGPADLIPQSPRRSGESAGMADWGAGLSGAVKSPDPWGSVSSESGGGVCRSGNYRASHCGTSPVQEICSPGSASGLSPKGHHDYLAAGFRRRCHTLDNQLHSNHSGVEHIDRSQERVPRFMAGVTWKAPSWRTPAAPLNQSFEVDSLSPSLLRPRMPPDMAQVTLKMEPEDTQGINNGQITATVLSRNAAEAQASKTEESQRRAQALEDMQRRLEEEHVLQMSLLLAEQEKEQQRLRLELEETERRLREQGGVRPLSGDVCGWNCRSVSDSRPVVSPSCPGPSPAHTNTSERSPGHSKGFPSPESSVVSSPSVQPPVCLWGPTWAVSKPRARLSLTSEQQRAFCRISAIIRGFLTRRLLKTEKVRHLRQTILDTQEFIRTFQTEAPQKRGLCSAQDRSLQGRVRAQLRAALYDIHDIFFEMPLGDRLSLLQQDRELRAERKLREMEKAKCPKERVVLSAATQRSLDRKKRVGQSPAQARKMQQKPKSPTTNRCQTQLVLKPSQGQHSPVPGQLNHQGSWYRKTPEERVRRSDSLKKQHSLG